MKFADILAMADSEAFVHPDGKKIPAVVHTAVYKTSSQGNDMIAVTYRVTGGPNAGKGRPIRHYLLFNDSGRQQVSNLGFPASEFAALGQLEGPDALTRIAAVIAGKPCAIDLSQETFNGRLQNKVTWVHAPSAAGNNGPKPAAAKKEKAETPVQEPEPDEDGDDEEAELERQLAAKRAAKAQSRRSTPPADLPF